MKPLQLHFSTFFFLLLFTCTYAQKSIVATGGKAAGVGGTSSYSVGQISYKSPNGNLVSDGVQQPYEISTLGKSTLENITLEINVFPNPTIGIANLKITSKNIADFNYQLFDISGKVLSKIEKISNLETPIDLRNYSKGIYLLQITAPNKKVKSFKIIKK
jgi:hypothetical protein